MFKNRVNRRHLLSGMYIISGFGLVVISLYRALTFPFTHDESLSFASFTWDTTWSDSPNNHLLNTFLMQICSRILGNSELSLRLPNIIAHAVFLVFSYQIVKRFDNRIFQIAGFILLNFNSFLFNFFFLARGYGLALALQLLSLYFTICAHEHREVKMRLIFFIYLAMFTGSLSVLAHFSFLNYFLALGCVNTWLVIREMSVIKQNGLIMRRLYILVFIISGFLVFILQKVIRFQRIGELYYGGSSGFMKDTIGSLLRVTISPVILQPSIIEAAAIVVFGFYLALIVIAGYQTIRSRKVTHFSLFSVLLLISYALPVFQNLILKVVFPIERYAISFLPLAALTLVSVPFNEIQFRKHTILRQSLNLFGLVLSAAVLWNFTLSLNIHSVYEWWYDANNHLVLKTIEEDRQVYFPDKNINLGCSWTMEPSLNYYRVSRNLNWLAPVTRDPISARGFDYIYAFIEETEGMDADKFSTMEIFPDTQTVLIRSNGTTHR